jgi:hypothetical protein
MLRSRYGPFQEYCLIRRDGDSDLAPTEDPSNVALFVLEGFEPAKGGKHVEPPKKRAAKRAGAAEEHRWCTTGTWVKQNEGPKVGEVTKDSNSDGKVQVRWLSGRPSYMLVSNLHEASDEERQAAESDAQAASNSRPGQRQLVRARRFHLGIGSYRLRFTYVTPVLITKLRMETARQVKPEWPLSPVIAGDPQPAAAAAAAAAEPAARGPHTGGAGGRGPIAVGQSRAGRRRTPTARAAAADADASTADAADDVRSQRSDARQAAANPFGGGGAAAAGLTIDEGGGGDVLVAPLEIRTSRPQDKRFISFQTPRPSGDGSFELGAIVRARQVRIEPSVSIVESVHID